MNIIVKRLFAFIIDLLVLGFFIFVLKQFTVIEKNSLKYAALFLPLFFRDFTFKGASIGKRFMRIRIYNAQWEKPSYKQILKRTWKMLLVNFETICEYGDFLNEGVCDAVIREYKAIGTRVVEDEVFERLSAGAKKLDGEWADNMTKLHNAYITNL